MKVLFVTREADVCRLMATYLSDEQTACTVTDDFLEFYLMLQAGNVTCDLAVLDFRLFQHTLGTVTETFRALKQPVPFVFYNDPYPDKTNRAVYWLQQNEMLYANAELHHLLSVFTRLNAVIEQPEVRPYVSLLQPPLPLRMTVDTAPLPLADTAADFDLTQFRVRTKIPPTLFSLFEYFYANADKEISVNDIARQLFGGGFASMHRRNAVYSYVSRLKKYIRAEPSCRCAIIRSSSERYKMVLNV